MIRLIIVAGSNSENLAKFFDKRGVFEIVATYDNLSSNVSQIQNKVIAADKLLYLFNTAESSDMNIKDDMQVLSTFLKNDIFFKPGEIVFMTDKSDLAKVAIKFFVTAMEDCNKTDYSIKTTGDKLSYVNIYNLLMGTSGSVDFKNTYTTLYKVERNTDALLEYPPKDERNLVIEPFNMDSVVEYAGRQKVVEKADTGTVYTDNPDADLPKLDSANLEEIPLASVTKDPKVIFVTGVLKSGKTSWATQLAMSAYYRQHSVCVLDLTENPDMQVTLNSASIKIDQTNLISVIRQQVPEHKITLAFPRNAKEREVTKDFLYLFANKDAFASDVIFVICDIEKLKDYRRLFAIPAEILLTSNATFDDVSAACNFLDTNLDGTRVTITLNDVVPNTNGEFASADTIKSSIPIDCRVVKAKQFTKIDTKGKLYTTLFGTVV